MTTTYLKRATTKFSAPTASGLLFVSFGDKVIGTNHVLPTRKAARYTGGLWVGMCIRTVTYQEITSLDAAARIGELCGRASRAENFEGHARAGDVRVAHAVGERPAWAN